MSEFFDRLPFEIISQIFSSMDQRDCLTMLQVSKEWYDKAPGYATGVWTGVDFTKGVAAKKNACLLQCLGPHVTNVHVSLKKQDEIKTNYIIAELKRRSCTFTKLTLQSEECHIELLPIRTEVLFRTLKPYGNHLVQLILRDTHDVSLLEIARVCPRLIFLSIRLAEKAKRRIKQEQVNQDYTNNKDDKQKVLLPDLLCLTLDIKFEFTTRIEPLLHHCPNLRVMRLASAFHLETTDAFRLFNQTNNRKHVDIERIINMCPYLFQLNYCTKVEINDLNELDFVNTRPSSIKKISINKNYQEEEPLIKEPLPTAFQYLEFYEDYFDPNIQNLIPFLNRTRDTLSTLHIFLNDRHQTRSTVFWEALETVTLPHLRDLSLSVATPNIRDSVPVLSLLKNYIDGTSSSLQNLSLRIWPPWVNTQLLRTLSELKSLKSLSLYIYSGSGDPFYHRHDVICLEALQRSALESLTLMGDIIMTTEMFQVLGALSRSVRHISLCPSTFGHNRSWSLKTDTHPKGGLLHFITRMKEYNHVESLEFEYIFHLDDDMIHLLGDTASLKSLKISGSRKLTSSGFRSFVNKKAGQRSIYVSVDISCMGVTYDDIQYAKSKLGKNNVKSNIRK